MAEDDKTRAAKAAGVKKEYHPPGFFIYGDIREITKSVGKSGAIDGGTGSMTQTWI